MKKELILFKYINFYYSLRKINDPTSKMEKYLNISFSKEDIHNTPRNMKKVLNHTNHQGDANQNHSEL